MDNLLNLFKVTEQDLEKLISTALSRGGDYADIFFQDFTGVRLTLSDNAVTNAGVMNDFGVGIRVLKGEQTGYAYSESTEMKEMEKAAITAASIADGLVQAKNPIEIKRIKGGRFYPAENNWKEVSTERRIEFLKRLDHATFAADSRVTKVLASLSESYERSLFFNSNGELAENAGPMVKISLSCVMVENGRTENASASRAFRIGPELLTDELIEELVKEVVDNCAILFKAGTMQGGRMAVVMGAGGSGILLHEAIGHAFEADFNRKGTSIFADKMGKRICMKGINVVDDGTIMHNRGAINFDDEGVPGQKTYMVSDGILNSYLHDRISARHYGVSPTGNGRRESFRFNPIPRMRATYMENGSDSREDLIAQVKKGVYVDSFSNGQVNIGAGDFTFFVRSGHMIENGHLTQPIRDINIIGNGPQALADIIGVANDLQIDNGIWTCGKGQNCPVSQGMPSVLVRELAVGGISG